MPRMLLGKEILLPVPLPAAAQLCGAMAGPDYEPLVDRQRARTKLLKKKHKGVLKDM